MQPSIFDTIIQYKFIPLHTLKSRATYLRQGLIRYDVLRCDDVLHHDVLGHDVLGPDVLDPDVLGQDDDVHHAGLQGRQLKS